MLTPGKQVIGVCKAGGRRMKKHDIARKTATSKGHRSGRCQKRVCTDVVPARIDMFLDLMKHDKHLMSCCYNVKHRVLQGCRVTACDTMDTLETTWICDVVAEQPRSTPARGHY